MDKMTERVEIQFTPRQMAGCKASAEKRGLKLAAWIRMVALHAADGAGSGSNDLPMDTTRQR